MVDLVRGELNVVVSIEVDDRVVLWSEPSAEGFEHGKRDGMVAAEHDRQSVHLEDRIERPSQLEVNVGDAGRKRADVAVIDDAQRAQRVESRSQ